jgi:hypothetical protein
MSHEGLFWVPSLTNFTLVRSSRENTRHRQRPPTEMEEPPDILDRPLNGCPEAYFGGIAPTGSVFAWPVSSVPSRSIPK